MPSQWEGPSTSFHTRLACARFCMKLAGLQPLRVALSHRRAALRSVSPCAVIASRLQPIWPGNEDPYSCLIARTLLACRPSISMWTCGEDACAAVRRLVRDLVATAKVLTTQETRRVATIVRWIEDTLLHKMKQQIRQCPEAPVLCMYSSDGWSATVTTHIAGAVGPHVVEHRGRVRHEFCLERALLRQRRPCGDETLTVMARRPLGMCTGRRHGNFFTAATGILPTLADLGARGIKIQLYLSNGLHFKSFMRLMRGRFFLRCSAGDAFGDDLERALHWSQEWVLGASCKSHSCSNAVV